WLAAVASALGFSDDERLHGAAVGLLTRLERDWTSEPTVEARMRAIDACLLAVALPSAHALAPAAIDALEHVIGRAYRPGEGMSHGLERFTSGTLGDQISSAGALLTAYSLSGRLPYTMLAEELVQFALRHSLLAAEQGDLASRCAAARVLCRLA